MTLQAGARLGSYEIRGLLGAGGMGEVYRAWDARLSREVAVKVLPASALSNADRLRRFEHEARAAGALNHPNVLTVHDVGSHDSIPYLVSELLQGDTLRGQISARTLTVRKAVEYAIQIARGLAAAHQRGIVHRDLKPENVFVTRDGHLKILDFGLAKLRDETPRGSEGETITGETRPGVILGTVPYMSPEQVRGLPADARSDIFALGSLLYEMLARRRAFMGETGSEIEAAILRTEPPELTAVDSQIPTALDRVVRRCLEKRPEDRFQTAQDVAFALEAVATTSARSPAVDAGVRRRSTLAHLAPLLAGLVLGALLVAALRRPATLPSYTQLTFRRGTILSARFAPDGQTVVYSAAWDGQPAQLYTTRLGSGESQPLGLEGVVLAVSSRNEVAVKRGRFLGRRTVGQPEMGTLARVSLSGGAPRDMLENVIAADWDPEGQELAVLRRVEGVKRLEFPIGHVVHEGDIFNVRVLPGGRLATFDCRQLGNVGSWLFDVLLFDRGGRKTVLSPGWINWPNLSWSEATREIFFVSNRGDELALRAVSLAGRERLVARIPGDFEQYDVDPRGRILLERTAGRGNVVGLAPGESRERDLTWQDGSSPVDISADGRQALLVSWDLQARESLLLRNTDGSAPVLLGEWNGLSLSPDGRFVLAFPGGQYSSDRLLLVPTGAGERRELRHAFLSQISTAAWFPDGRRIAVLNGEERRRQRLFLWDVEMSAAPRPLSPEGDMGSPVVSSDGRWVAAGVADSGVVLYPVDGGPARSVLGSAPQDEPLRWSADGRWLFVSRSRLPTMGFPRAFIDRIEIATGARQQWKELSPVDPAGAGGIFRVCITPDGKNYVYGFGSSIGSLFLAEGLR